MKSFLGKSMDSDAGSDEDYQFLPQNETGRQISDDIKQLMSFEQVFPGINARLESILAQQSPNEIVSRGAGEAVEISNEIEKYVLVAEKYKSEIPFARRSLGKRLKLVKTAVDGLDSAVARVAGELCLRLDERQKSINNTNNISEAIGAVVHLRKEMDLSAEAYKTLKARFGSKVFKPNIESYLQKMPGIALVRKELDEIAEMLETDQSVNDFFELDRRRKDIKGIILPGRLKKAACRLNYAEGIARCSELKDQIDQYIKEFPKVKACMAEIGKMHEKISDAKQALFVVSVPDENSASALEAAHGLIFKKGLPKNQGYKFLNGSYENLAENIGELSALFGKKCSDIYALAAGEYEAINPAPEPQGIGELNSAITELRRAEPRLGLLARLFKAMNKDDDCAECYSRQSMITSKIANLADLQKQYSAVEQEMSSLNAMKKEAESLFSDSSLLDYDLKRAVGIMKYQLPDFLDTHLIRNARSECVSLCEDVKKKAHEKLVQGLSRLVSHYSAPLQQTGSLDADETAINSRLLTIRNMVIPFIKNGFSEIAQMKAEEYSQTLEKAANSLNATLGAFRELRKQRKEYEQKIGEMKLALDKTDSSEIGRLANMPIVDQVSNPYVSGLAKDYNRLVWHLRRAQSGISSEPQASGSENAVVKEQPSDGPFNFFEYVDCRMPAPASPVLKGLKKQLLSGTVASRLSTLEGVIGKVADMPLKAEDLEWLSQLKDAYEKDLSEGYFSQHSDGESRGQLSRIMGMMRDYFKK